MKIFISPQAARSLNRACKYHEQQKEGGALKLRSIFAEVIQRIEQYPGMYPEKKGYHAAPVKMSKRSAYLVFYDFDDSALRIYDFVHQSSDWKPL